MTLMRSLITNEKLWSLFFCQSEAIRWTSLYKNESVTSEILKSHLIALHARWTVWPSTPLILVVPPACYYWSYWFATSIILPVGELLLWSLAASRPDFQRLCWMWGDLQKMWSWVTDALPWFWSFHGIWSQNRMNTQPASMFDQKVKLRDKKVSWALYSYTSDLSKALSPSRVEQNVMQLKAQTEELPEKSLFFKYKRNWSLRAFQIVIMQQNPHIRLHKDCLQDA